MTDLNAHNDKMILSYIKFTKDLFGGKCKIIASKTEHNDSSRLSEKDKLGNKYTYLIELTYLIKKGERGEYDENGKIVFYIKKSRFGLCNEIHLTVKKSPSHYSSMNTIFEHSIKLSNNSDLKAIYKHSKNAYITQLKKNKKEKLELEQRKEEEANKRAEEEAIEKIKADVEAYETVIPLKYKRLSKLSNLTTHDSKK